MNNGVEIDRKVYFELKTTISRRMLARAQQFLLDGASGNMTFNIKDGEILGVHITEILSSKGPPPARRRTA